MMHKLVAFIISALMVVQGSVVYAQDVQPQVRVPIPGVPNQYRVSGSTVCGEAAHREVIAGTTGAVSGVAAGAATGAAVGATCDVAFLGLTLGICTVVGGLVGSAFGAIAGVEGADALFGQRNCAGVVHRYRDRDGKEAVWFTFNRDDYRQAIRDGRRAAERRSSSESEPELLAVFDTKAQRCAAVSFGGGRAWVGIGPTHSHAVAGAKRMCEAIEGEGVCNLGRDTTSGRVPSPNCNTWE